LYRDRLSASYKDKTKLSGIIYLHRISDNRMTGASLKNLRMFDSLCGQDALPSVILVTTMWDEIREEAGVRREKELIDTFWKDMADSGCKTARFNHAYDSAWKIVDSLLPKDQEPLQLSKDIVDDKLRLKETKAGVTLHDELQRLMKDQKEATRRLREHSRKQDNPQRVQQLKERTAEIEAKIRQTAEQLRELKIPLTKQVFLFLIGRSRQVSDPVAAGLSF